MATRKRHTPEQVVRKLAEADRLPGEGKSVADVCRQLQVSEQTYFSWRNQFGGLKADDAKRLKKLERENATLKRLLADAELEKAAFDAVGIDQDVVALRIVDPARTQRRSRERHGVVEQSHDPTGQGVGVASDTELDEQRKAVVVDAFANEVGAIELEDQQHRHVDSAAGRWQAAIGSPVGAVQARLSHHAVTVVTQ